VPQLLRPNKHLHDALMRVCASSLVFIGNMFVTQIASGTNNDLLAGVVLTMFLFGVAVLFAGALVVIGEVRASHRVSQSKTQRTLRVSSPKLRTPIARIVARDFRKWRQIHHETQR